MNTIVTCLRCGHKREVEARGLCQPCYLYFRRHKGRLAYPLKDRIRIPPNGDPLIRWVFQEIKAQGKTLGEVCEAGGVSHNLRTWREHGNPYFQNFRAVVEALGYEIRIVAKEPKNAADQTTD